MNDEHGDVVLRLSSDEALVLFEWVSRSNETATDAHFEDQAEQRVLWNLESLLEASLAEPFNSNYDELLAQARSRLRDSLE